MQQFLSVHVGMKSMLNMTADKAIPKHFHFYFILYSHTHPWLYGFLVVVLVSACSVLGVLFLTLLNKHNKFHGLYKSESTLY